MDLTDIPQCFQSVSGHVGLPDNVLADSLAKTGAALPFADVPSH